MDTEQNEKSLITKPINNNMKHTTDKIFSNQSDSKIVLIKRCNDKSQETAVIAEANTIMENKVPLHYKTSPENSIQYERDAISLVT